MLYLSGHNTGRGDSDYRLTQNMRSALLLYQSKNTALLQRSRNLARRWYKQMDSYEVFSQSANAAVMIPFLSDFAQDIKSFVVRSKDEIAAERNDASGARNSPQSDNGTSRDTIEYIRTFGIPTTVANVILTSDLAKRKLKTASVDDVMIPLLIAMYQGATYTESSQSYRTPIGLIQHENGGRIISNSIMRLFGEDSIDNLFKYADINFDLDHYKSQPHRYPLYVHIIIMIALDPLSINTTTKQNFFDIIWDESNRSYNRYSLLLRTYHTTEILSSENSANRIRYMSGLSTEDFFKYLLSSYPPIKDGTLIQHYGVATANILSKVEKKYRSDLMSILIYNYPSISILVPKIMSMEEIKQVGSSDEAALTMQKIRSYAIGTVFGFTYSELNDATTITYPDIPDAFSFILDDILVPTIAENLNEVYAMYDQIRVYSKRVVPATIKITY